MEVLPIVFSVVLVVLAIVLSVVGVQVIMVLIEVKRTLKKLNDTLDMAENRLNAIVQPIKNLGGMAAGMSAGFKVFESFVGWLNRSRGEK